MVFIKSYLSFHLHPFSSVMYTEHSTAPAHASKEMGDTGQPFSASSATSPASSSFAYHQASFMPPPTIPCQFFQEKDPFRCFRLPSILMDSWEFRKIAPEGSVLPNAFCTHVLHDDTEKEVKQEAKEEAALKRMPALPPSSASDRPGEKAEPSSSQEDGLTRPPPSSLSSLSPAAVDQKEKKEEHRHSLKEKAKLEETYWEEEESEMLFIGTTEGFFFVLYPQDEVREPICMEQLTGTISVVLYAKETQQLVLVTLEGTCVVQDRFARRVSEKRKEKHHHAVASTGEDEEKKNKKRGQEGGATEQGKGMAKGTSPGRLDSTATRRFRVAANCFCGDLVKDDGGEEPHRTAMQEESGGVEKRQMESHHGTPSPPLKTHLHRGNTVKTIPNEAPSASLMPSSSSFTTRLLLGSMDRFIYLYDIQDGVLLLSLYMHHPVTDVTAFGAPLASPPLLLSPPPPLVPPPRSLTLSSAYCASPLGSGGVESRRGVPFMPVSSSASSLPAFLSSSVKGGGGGGWEVRPPVGNMTVPFTSTPSSPLRMAHSSTTPMMTPTRQRRTSETDVTVPLFLISTPVSVVLLSGDSLRHRHWNTQAGTLPLILADPVALHYPRTVSSSPASPCTTEKDASAPHDEFSSMVASVQKKRGQHTGGSEHGSLHRDHPPEEEKEKERGKRPLLSWESWKAGSDDSFRSPPSSGKHGTPSVLHRFWQDVLQRAFPISPLWMVYISPQGFLMVPPLWDMKVLRRIIEKEAKRSVGSSTPSPALRSSLTSHPRKPTGGASPWSQRKKTNALLRSRHSHTAGWTSRESGERGGAMYRGGTSGADTSRDRSTGTFSVCHSTESTGEGAEAREEEVDDTTLTSRGGSQETTVFSKSDAATRTALRRDDPRGRSRTRHGRHGAATTSSHTRKTAVGEIGASPEELSSGSMTSSWSSLLCSPSSSTACSSSSSTPTTTTKAQHAITRSPSGPPTTTTVTSSQTGHLTWSTHDATRAASLHSPFLPPTPPPHWETRRQGREKRSRPTMVSISDPTPADMEPRTALEEPQEERGSRDVDTLTTRASSQTRPSLEPSLPSSSNEEEKVGMSWSVSTGTSTTLTMRPSLGPHLDIASAEGKDTSCSSSSSVSEDQEHAHTKKRVGRRREPLLLSRMGSFRIRPKQMKKSTRSRQRSTNASWRRSMPSNVLYSHPKRHDVSARKPSKKYGNLMPPPFSQYYPLLFSSPSSAFFSPAQFTVRTSVDVGISGTAVHIFVVIEDGRAFALYLEASLWERQKYDKGETTRKKREEPKKDTEDDPNRNHLYPEEERGNPLGSHVSSTEVSSSSSSFHTAQKKDDAEESNFLPTGSIPLSPPHVGRRLPVPVWSSPSPWPTSPVRRQREPSPHPTPHAETTAPNSVTRHSRKEKSKCATCTVGHFLCPPFTQRNGPWPHTVGSPSPPSFSPSQQGARSTPLSPSSPVNAAELPCSRPVSQVLHPWPCSRAEPDTGMWAPSSSSSSPRPPPPSRAIPSSSLVCPPLPGGVASQKLPDENGPPQRSLRPLDVRSSVMSKTRTRLEVGGGGGGSRGPPLASSASHVPATSPGTLSTNEMANVSEEQEEDKEGLSSPCPPRPPSGVLEYLPSSFSFPSFSAAEGMGEMEKEMMEKPLTRGVRSSTSMFPFGASSTRNPRARTRGTGVLLLSISCTWEEHLKVPLVPRARVLAAPPVSFPSPYASSMLACPGASVFTPPLAVSSSVAPVPFTLSSSHSSASPLTTLPLPSSSFSPSTSVLPAGLGSSSLVTLATGATLQSFYFILLTMEGSAYLVHFPSRMIMKCTVMRDGCTFTVGRRANSSSTLTTSPFAPPSWSSTSPPFSSLHAIQSILCACVSVDAVSLSSLGAVQECIQPTISSTPLKMRETLATTREREGRVAGVQEEQNAHGDPHMTTVSMALPLDTAGMNTTEDVTETKEEETEEEEEEMEEDHLFEEEALFLMENYPNSDTLTDAEILLELGNVLVSLAMKENTTSVPSEDEHDDEANTRDRLPMPLSSHEASYTSTPGEENRTTRTLLPSPLPLPETQKQAAEEGDTSHPYTADVTGSASSLFSPSLPVKMDLAGTAASIASSLPLVSMTVPPSQAKPRRARHRSNPSSHQPITSLFKRLLLPSSSFSFMPTYGKDGEESEGMQSTPRKKKNSFRYSEMASSKEEEKERLPPWPLCTGEDEEDEDDEDEEFQVGDTTIRERIYVARHVLNSYSPEEWAILRRLSA